MSKAIDLVSIRQAKESDKPFVFKSWINCNYSASPAKKLPRSIYFPGHWKVINRIWDNSYTLIVNSKDHEDHIIGFITFRRLGDQAVIDFIYVKGAFRNMGIGKMLFSTAMAMVHPYQEKPFIYTHRTYDMPRAAESGIFNPYLAHEVIGEGQESESDAGAESRQLLSGRNVFSS